jgi:curli biogenesis system outer membrane secretion channel CsgG
MLVGHVQGVTKVHNNLQVNNPKDGQQASYVGNSGEQQMPSSQPATAQSARLQYGTQQPAAPGVDYRVSGKKKIAIYPFDDRTSANRPMSTAEIISGRSLGQGLGVKVSDAIISKLAGTGNFEVVDREYLNSVMAEKNLKYDPNFDPAGAARSGLLGVVDILIVGRIDSFNANVTSSQTGFYVGTRIKQTGVTNLKVTARLISIEKGTILSAPSASASQTGVLSQSTTVQGMGNGAGTANDGSGLGRLVDQTVDAVSADLSAKISIATQSEVAARTLPSIPKFVGIENGLTVINRGTNAGIKVGDRFNVVRPTVTGLVDPDTNQPIIRKKQLCTLVISIVEDTISSGSCEGGVPAKGDEIAPTQSK